jgi:uncharacterized protein YuzE
MKITYDRSIDAVYIYLNIKANKGQVAKTYPCNPIEVGGEINLDFDSDGKLLGVEVMNASNKLSKDIIENAENIS